MCPLSSRQFKKQKKITILYLPLPYSRGRFSPSNGGVPESSYGWDNDGERYIHVTTTGIGTAKLYAQDWNENGNRDECSVTVITPYAKRLQDIGGFSSEETSLILSLYDNGNVLRKKGYLNAERNDK